MPVDPALIPGVIKNAVAQLALNNHSPQAVPGVKPPLSVPHTPREQVVVAAQWGIVHHGLFDYSEASNRWDWAKGKPFDTGHRIETDCSGFVTMCHKWAGAPDPNGNSFHGGYTGTLLTHCQHIPAAQVKPGDLVVYGPGTGTHVQLVIQRINATDFWEASHGHQGAPERVQHTGSATWFQQHGHPGVTFLRCPGLA